MQISGTRDLQVLRQPGSLATDRHGGQRLVFVYPILFDDTSNKFMNLIRDFFATYFTGEIKVANVINVTSDATRIGMIGSGANAVNPADEVYRSIYRMDSRPDYNLADYYRRDPYIDRRDYQERIHNFLHFIRNQIQFDPRYQSLRPMISNITVSQNLINIPMIIGTKAYPVNADSLYWFLLVALMWNIPLNSRNNIQRISNQIRAIPPKNYIDLLFSIEGRREIENLAGITVAAPHGPISKSYSVANPNSTRDRILGMISDRDLVKLGSYIDTETDKTSRFFNMVLDISRWSAETNGITSPEDMAVNRPVIQTDTQRRHYESAMGTFSSYLNSVLVPIIHSIEVLLGPTPIAMNFNDAAQWYLGQLNGTPGVPQGGQQNISGTFAQISQHIVNELRTLSQLADGADKATINKLEEMKQWCKDNANTANEVRNVIDRLNSRRVGVNSSGTELAEFIRALEEAATTFRNRSDTITGWLSAICSTDPSGIRTLLGQVFDHFLHTTQAFFYNNVGSNPFPIYDRAGYNPVDFNSRFSNFINFICTQPGGAVRMTCPRELEQIVNELITLIPQVIYFLFLFVFFSYTCNYMYDIEIDIATQRRDALDFPNYCLVLPLDIFKGLFALHAIRNFETIINQPNPRSTHSEISRMDHIVPNFDDVKNIIETVNKQLHVPNLILVDHKKQEIYFMFMFMKKPIRMTMESLKQFVQHQQDVLPGF